MLKVLTFIAPFILKGAVKDPAKSLAGQSAFYGLFFFGFLFLLAAVFTCLMKTYSLEVAFSGLGIILIAGALTIKFFQWQSQQKSKPKAKRLPYNIENDALAAHIPDNIKDDPLLKKILNEIGEKPLAATATALTLGVLLSREYFD